MVVVVVVVLLVVTSAEDEAAAANRASAVSVRRKSEVAAIGDCAATESERCGGGGGSGGGGGFRSTSAISSPLFGWFVFGERGRGGGDFTERWPFLCLPEKQRDGHTQSSTRIKQHRRPAPINVGPISRSSRV